jgi:hypothetical protein
MRVDQERDGTQLGITILQEMVIENAFFNRVTGEGLEPSTNGLTYLIGFHRPRGHLARPFQLLRTGEPGVESLDYPIAIAGVPRLVSEAEAGLRYDRPLAC